jgi:allantoin racemase
VEKKGLALGTLHGRRTHTVMTRRARIALINPNATKLMTDQMVTTLRDTLGEGVDLLAFTNTHGPAAIQGPDDVAACLPGVFDAYARAVSQGVQAVIIGCFDDTGLTELRLRGPVPVVGLGEAGCTAAVNAAERFVVVTTLAVSIPEIRANIARYGLSRNCAAVIASGVPVLALAKSVAQIDETIAQAKTDYPKAAYVLGCSGMTAIVAQLTCGQDDILIDPVKAAGAQALDLAQRRPLHQAQ